MPVSPLDRLFKEPWRFSFFQAVRVLEADGRRTGRDPRFEGRVPVGEDGDPLREVVRFRVPPTLTFPPSEIVTLTRQETEEASRPAPPPDMTVAFLGMTGPSGALPQHYTETLIRDIRSRSFALRDFLDLFNHRLVSLLMRGWEKYRLTAAYEHHGAGGADPVSGVLFSLIGFGTGSLRSRLAVDEAGKARIDDEALLHYAGHLAHWPRSAAALETLLSDYFERPIRIDQFRGRWISLSDDEVSSPPSAALPEGRYCQLGVNAVAGTRVWDVQSGFRLKIGPLTYDQFLSFMPDGDELVRLAHLVRLFVGPAMSCDVQVTLRKEDVPDLAMSPETPPRLGWNTWAKTEPSRHDVDDAVYSLDSL